MIECYLVILTTHQCGQDKVRPRVCQFLYNLARSQTLLGLWMALCSTVNQQSHNPQMVILTCKMHRSVPSWSSSVFVHTSFDQHSCNFTMSILTCEMQRVLAKSVLCGEVDALVQEVLYDGTNSIHACGV